jgi:hypothetical protein
MMKTFVLALTLVLAAIAVAARADTGFSPSGPTVTLAVTGTTARVQVQASSGVNIRIFNSGTVPVFIVCGDSGSVATLATSMPVAPGTVEIIGCGQSYIAGISAGTAATVYLTPGNGL